MGIMISLNLRFFLRKERGERMTQVTTGSNANRLMDQAQTSELQYSASTTTEESGKGGFWRSLFGSSNKNQAKVYKNNNKKQNFDIVDALVHSSVGVLKGVAVSATKRTKLSSSQKVENFIYEFLKAECRTKGKPSEDKILSAAQGYATENGWIIGDLKGAYEKACTRLKKKNPKLIKVDEKLKNKRDKIKKDSKI